MTSQTITRHVEEDARLCLLTMLYQQNDGHLNDLLCAQFLEAYGHFRSRDWVRTQLRKMEDVGAIRLNEMDTVLIAQITAAGVDHILRKGRVEGIKQPPLGA
ncbi:VpaChn25_0724 family phage protein [Methylobacterium sp. sgz302541]|uniref:VpaChn25_0724 family phage protein n=1 Tax=unclassified Methylobacterium TaxID=2615210 RepID=UPI003D34CFAA